MISRSERGYWIATAFIAVLTTSCGSFQDPHANFKDLMDFNLGRSATSPDVFFVRYPEFVDGVLDLPSGDKEVVYRADSYYGPCTVYFLVDGKTNLVSNWRFDGTEETCIHFY